MIKRKVQKIKSSYLVTIPSQLCGLMSIGKGTIMGIELKDNKIIMYPVKSNQNTNEVTGIISGDFSKSNSSVLSYNNISINLFMSVHLVLYHILSLYLFK